MDLLTNKIDEFVDSYNYYLTRADPRVADWFLMQSYTPTLVLSVAYLLVVSYGIRWMRDRPAYELRWPLVIYNSLLVALNFHICRDLVVGAWRRNYSCLCQPVDYSDNPDEMMIARAIWWYYFSKCIEFLDTFFFVLRKKNSQITFLHVYHHATMFPIWWIGTKWVPGGQSFFGAALNSFIHVVMYTYYAVAALGPDFQKYLWWKRYLTRLQLVQFVAGISHSIQALYFGCDFPQWMHWALVAYGTSILFLFLNFYFQAYIRPVKGTRKPRTNGTNCKSISNGSAHKQDPADVGSNHHASVVSNGESRE